MSIKPVDMQILLPRSQEIQKKETIKDSKSSSNNQFVLIENEKEAVKKTKQINETNKIKIRTKGNLLRARKSKKKAVILCPKT